MLFIFYQCCNFLCRLYLLPNNPIIIISIWDMRTFGLIAVVVQSLSNVQPFATSWTAALQASLSFTISQSFLKLMSTELTRPSNHLILCCPLLLLPSVFPSIRVFSVESVLCIRWPKYWHWGTDWGQAIYSTTDKEFSNYWSASNLSPSHSVKSRPPWISDIGFDHVMILDLLDLWNVNRPEVSGDLKYVSWVWLVSCILAIFHEKNMIQMDATLQPGSHNEYTWRNPCSRKLLILEVSRQVV